MDVFVVYYATFDYKPGHMAVECIGVFTDWSDAFRAALNYDKEESNDGEDSNSSEESNDKYYAGELPTTVEQLRRLISSDGCVWGLSPGKSAQWWNGSDCGSRLMCVTSQTVTNKSGGM